MDDCEQRDERASIPYGGSPARAFVMAHKEQAHKEQGVTKARSQQGLGSLGAGRHRTYRVVSKTPMKAVMVTSMGEGDRAVRGRPFTLRGNCAGSGRTWRTIL